MLSRRENFVHHQKVLKTNQKYRNCINCFIMIVIFCILLYGNMQLLFFLFRNLPNNSIFKKKLRLY